MYRKQLINAAEVLQGSLSASFVTEYALVEVVWKIIIGFILEKNHSIVNYVHIVQISYQIFEDI